MNLQSTKMGMHEWAYANDYNPAERRLMPHVSLKERFKKLNIEVELGFTVEQIEKEVQRCLNCDVQTVFETKLCIECDACIDICPVDCLTITHNGEEADLRTRLKAPAKNVTQALYVSVRAETYRARHGQRRRPVCALRPVRGALPDRGLGHAEVHRSSGRMPRTKPPPTPPRLPQIA